MIKIAITGVESTGKTTLAQQLAQHFKTIWVREYAREYLQKLNQKYGFEDILTIAQHQHRLISKAIRTNPQLPIIFIDTELLVTHIWCEYVFGKHHAWISKHLIKQDYDLYLLCDIDLPWQADPLREHPKLHVRQAIHQLYKQYLQKLSFPYVLISGQDEQRLHNAVKAIQERFQILQ